MTTPKLDSPDLDRGAQRLIIGILRERCPTGFFSAEENEKRAKLSPLQRKSIATWAASYPGSLNLQDIDGRTPLTWLVRYDEPALIRRFLALGANPRGAAGSCPHAVHPLSQACELRHGRALEAIALAAGVDDILIPVDPRYFKEQPSSGATALFVAAMNTNARGIATLLALGANPRALTANGDTPMHALAFFKKKPSRGAPCAQLLLAAFADMILVENNDGLTPAKLAAAHESLMAAPLLAMEEARRFSLSEGNQDPQSCPPRLASPRL